MVDTKETDKKPIEAVEEEKPLTIKINSGFRPKTFIEKFKHARDNITVEPLLAGLIIPSIISKFAMGNFNLDKACRVNFDFGDEICDSLVSRESNNYTYYEQQIQKLISSIDIWKSIVQTSIPCIIIMFLGAWSDRTGRRKLCILLPIFGEFITSINNLINVYYFYEIPLEVTVLLETILPAFTGGWMTMFLGVFSYITDITTEETRTFRVGMVNFCMTVGMPIGISLSGTLLKTFGYYTIFSMTCLMFFLVLSYGFLCLKEPDEILKEKGLPLPDRSDNASVSFFNLSHVAETARVAIRPRPDNRRMKILLTLFVVFILFGPTMSEHSVLYLYVRNQLNWDMVKFSFLIGYSVVLHSIGALFSITVLSRRYQMHDSLLCLISCISKFVGSMWTAFVKTDLEMFLLPVVEILNATTFTTLRSMTSKMIDKRENAKVNSLFSLTETLASLVFHPFYSWTYMKTLTVLPGAVFIISALLVIPASVVLIFFYIYHRRELREARKASLDAEEKAKTEKEKTKL